MTAPHVVVVGSGIAGLTAALHAAASGCRVTVVTKDVLDHANTRFAQGGIAGVMFDDDRLVDHLHDTMTAGAGLSDPLAVRTLVAEGPARIRELVELGVGFDRDAGGAFVKGLEAAHSYPRILHAGGDATGTAIERALVERVRASAVRVVEHAFLVDLVVAGPVRVSAPGLASASAHEPRRIARSSEDCAEILRTSSNSPKLVSTEPRPAGVERSDAGPVRVVGVELLVDGERTTLDADAVVLATGGAGQLYAHTTNPPVATGDGIAAALRAGAAVADLEFVQFHPTVLPGTDAFLVSEAVRGEGAVLIDDDGARFAFDDHPDGELAPRDVLARAIARRMAAQGGRPVRLDATGLRATPAETSAFLARRFPTIDAAVRARGLDWARAPVPVTPAAHYLMGGIATDLHGRTSVPGLYAVGEVARTGVHGANRLASNSLLEGAVFGARAGDVVAGDVASARAGAPWPVAPSNSGAATGAGGRPERAPGDEQGPARAPHPERGQAPEPAHAPPLEPFSRAALQRLMWDRAGLIRDGAGLRHAAATIAAWRAAERNPVTVAELEDENLLEVAAALVAAASARTASIGAHFRSDDTAQAHAERADEREGAPC
ncbi:L-aspartate oxidase [Microbacterium sp.]|uniref:L-aspartate oxidase n=1 Tax=Microbacterium sp. TaxID=51671 RepID=UPI0039E5D06D